jgi:gamma-glutamylcyclotransferase (GGCT)/AIG2-like uncharacterized protein YtfP
VEDGSEKVNLFAYGSLRHAAFIESITGGMHTGESAFLHGYKKFFTHFGFPFIVHEPGGKVHGKCYFGLSAEELKKIDHFECEGTLYDRKEVTVAVHGRPIKAQAYIANLIHLRRSFGPKMDMALVEKVERFIEEHAGERIDILAADPGEPEAGSDLTAWTRQELFGSEIFNLLNMLLLDKYVSDYTIDSRLKIRGLPTLKGIRRDPEKTAYAPSYLWLAMRFIVLNQFEDIFRHQFRSELFHRMPFSRFTLSLLAALMLYNRHSSSLDERIMEEGGLRTTCDGEYFDYASRAVRIGQTFYLEHQIEAGLIVREILLEPQHGLVPIGAELEFSDVGRLAIRQDRPEDSRFRHFLYFYDYDMDRRCWKLGGHVDDHKFSHLNRETDGGFLEYSLGKSDVVQEDSQPVTEDPRILARLIQELVKYTPVRPHSLHLAYQDRDDPPLRDENDPEMLLCLLLLGGDMGWDENGELVEKRIHYEETTDPWGSLHFIRENFHHLIGTEEERKPLRVIEYQFPRLDAHTSYEPLIVALKGFQLGYRPRPMSSVATIRYQEAAEPEINALKKWAGSAKPLSDRILADFLEVVEKGLNQEKKKSRAHAKRYIRKMLFEIEKELVLRNEWIQQVTKERH